MINRVRIFAWILSFGICFRNNCSLGDEGFIPEFVEVISVDFAFDGGSLLLKFGCPQSKDFLLVFIEHPSQVEREKSSDALIKQDYLKQSVRMCRGEQFSNESAKVAKVDDIRKLQRALISGVSRSLLPHNDRIERLTGSILGLLGLIGEGIVIEVWGADAVGFLESGRWFFVFVVNADGSKLSDSAFK